MPTGEWLNQSSVTCPPSLQPPPPPLHRTPLKVPGLPLASSILLLLLFLLHPSSIGTLSHLSFTAIPSHPATSTQFTVR
ncbi:hypothetical protein BO82DRAFT_67446 [Aspergillus uvarum CBS 121591]|uniref:Uncharacterized protein n=1 Tax=Aspergillus uvarum CBS 121591 TaxID=1448315 RepID=A0A319CTH0_9EURO|nr:hypothetical protein BO82DRAFT_67446 [Aspergillus uvarum CBS 121591]PYH82093.1 hypothetical protein BO82DRAFT_67446 [Aspergillus uvarum CBS 121591]